MLTVSRPVAAAAAAGKKTSNPDGEATKERLIFSMDKQRIVELTMHVADYIRARRALCAAYSAKEGRQLYQQQLRRTAPRRSPQRPTSKSKQPLAK